MLAVDKFMDSATLTHLKHPYKVGEQMAYLQSQFAARMWMGKSQRILLKENRSFKIKLLTFYDHSLAELIYFYVSTIISMSNNSQICISSHDHSPQFSIHISYSVPLRHLTVSANSK